MLIVCSMLSIGLDYDTQLFLSMFSSSPRTTMEINQGQIVYKHTGNAPPLVRYNGGAACDKVTDGRLVAVEWMRGFCARDLLGIIKQRQKNSTTTGTLTPPPARGEEQQQVLFEQLFTFVDERFERVPPPHHRRILGC